jgi:hypothetical protein
LQPEVPHGPGSWMTSVVRPPRARRRPPAGQPVHVGVHAAGRDEHPRGVVDRGGGVEHDVDAVHRVRVAGAPDAHDPPAADADGGVADAEDRVDEHPARDGDLDPERSARTPSPSRMLPPHPRRSPPARPRVRARARCRPAGRAQAPR